MNKKITIVIAAQTALIILLFWVLVQYAKDEYHAISDCRQLVKKEYNTKSIWFTNIKKL